MCLCVCLSGEWSMGVWVTSGQFDFLITADEHHEEFSTILYNSYNDSSYILTFTIYSLTFISSLDNMWIGMDRIIVIIQNTVHCTKNERKI